LLIYRLLRWLLLINCPLLTLLLPYGPLLYRLLLTRWNLAHWHLLLHPLHLPNRLPPHRRPTHKWRHTYVYSQTRLRVPATQPLKINARNVPQSDAQPHSLVRKLTSQVGTEQRAVFVALRSRGDSAAKNDSSQFSQSVVGAQNLHIPSWRETGDF
jgi:hypothetical protein